ncbi:MAG: phosphate acyltransferase PlsX [Geminicoccaceae bacterium]
MKERLILALDAMGGDDAPAMVIDGAALAFERDPEIRFLMVGDENRLRPLLARHHALEAACEFRHTEEFVAGDAKPSTALRQGRNSSMRLAIDAVRDGQAAAAVSAGNTGALMAMAKVVLRTLPSIDRPAIASVLPSRQRPVVMLDLGANVDCSAENLLQFAVMGEVFARAVLDVEKPRIGLLNVGTEEVKGDNVVREAATLLRDSGLDIDYAGFVEGNDVIDGSVDVVVTDGFTGNVALKIAEGTASLYAGALRTAFRSSLRGKLAYLLGRSALGGLRAKFDPRLYNGAMFLGVNGVVVKSHGGTDAVGFATAIKAAVDIARRGTNERIIAEMKSLAAEPDPAETAAR